MNTWRAAVRACASARRACGVPVAGLIALATTAVSRNAVAQDSMLPEASRTFEYTSPAEKHYVRPILEEVFLLGAGVAQYFSQRDTNSVDWDLDYDWPSFRAKLVGDAYAFDTNKFDTNFLTHPGSGTLYYLAARGNRLSVLEALGFSFAASTLWEFVAEFREQVSVNDFFVTPLAGFAIGESTIQLAAFFDRSCPTFTNQVLGSVLGPTKSAHDAIDGVRPRRDDECDSNGFTSHGSHRFRFSAGGANVWSGTSRSGSSEARMAVETAVQHLDSLGKPGQGWLTFSDGNLATLGGAVAIGAGRVTDMKIAARSIPAGLHHRDVTGGRGYGLNGSEVVIGVLVGAEYSQHRYERPAGKLDRIFVLDAPATTLNFVAHRGSQGFEVGLDAGATLAGVDAFALRDYLGRNSDAGLPTVTRVQGYSHAFGFALTPRVRVRFDGAELGLDGRADRFYGIRVLDRLQASPTRVSVTDVRRRAALWLSVGPVRQVPRITLFIDAAQRAGTVMDVEKRRSEVGFGASMDAVF